MYRSCEHSCLHLHVSKPPTIEDIYMLEMFSGVAELTSAFSRDLKMKS